MKKVLIITPNWPPVSCPDLHRVRTSLSFFQEFGWEPLILKVNPDEQEGVKDEILVQTVPENTKTWQSGYLKKSWTSWLKINSIGWRSFFHLAKLGSEIIVREKPDLVFFSTTMFPLMSLGRYWHFKHNVPYVLDFQDPWVNDYYSHSSYSQVPGGEKKYRTSQQIAKVLESFSLRKVSHVISVSPKYPKVLLERYPWLSEEQFTVLPFGAPQKDFELLPSFNIKQTIFDPNDGKRHWVYVGRGGTDMAFSLRSLFFAIASEREKNPENWQSVKLHFIGTSYAPKKLAVKTVEPIAQEFGIEDLVEEYPHRVPYFQALQILVNSDAILLIGSDDASYTASKLYPCILAKKPIFAVFHQQSSVISILRNCEAGQVVTFTSNDKKEELLPAITNQLNWLLSIDKGYQPQTKWKAFEPYTAREMARQLCHIFNNLL
ncbi:MAG: hypothetical protein AAF378_08180 [Cyanobacteria bacterium P01_A01_bin.84]